MESILLSLPEIMAFIKVFILVLVCTFVDARSSGAQTPTACQDMTPRHNSAAAQSTPAPYSIVLSNNTYYGGERIRGVYLQHILVKFSLFFECTANKLYNQFD